MSKIRSSTRRRFLSGALALGAASWGRTLQSAEGTPEASLLVAWNRAVLGAVQSSAASPCLASRALAIVHAAAHDAFSTQSGKGSLLTPEGGLTQPDAPPAAAMAVAASVTASALFTPHRPVFEALLKKQLEIFPANTRAAAISAGTAWADAHMAGRAGDGASRTVTYIPVHQPGRWRRTPARMRPPELPQWPQVKAFALNSASQFRPSAPPELASPEYVVGWSRTRDIGGAASIQRSAEETLIAKFWSCFSYTVTPAGHWSVILGDLAEARRLPLARAVRAFALLGTATADAAIAAWDAKYAYEFWRPVHAIPLAAEDGNPATQADPAWKPLLETPPHPEYVSGHSVMGRAGAEVLRAIWGRDDIAFDAHSDTLTGVTRPFTSFQTSADEMSISRIFGGIHFPFSTDSGQILGKAVARRAMDWMDEKVPL